MRGKSRAGFLGSAAIVAGLLALGTQTWAPVAHESPGSIRPSVAPSATPSTPAPRPSGRITATPSPRGERLDQIGTPIWQPTPPPPPPPPASKRPATPPPTTPPPTTPPPTSSPPTVPDGRGKVLYLSFDDGPHGTWTPQVLQQLAAHGAHATFFLLGNNAAGHADLVQAIRKGGNSVAGHTMSHPDLTKLDNKAVTWQVAQVQKVLGPLKCTRPPYGAVTPRVTGIINGLGQRMQLWDIDTRDWTKPGSTAIANTVLKQARNGAVVLMHDGGGDRSQTVGALKILLPKLKAAGWSLQAIPGC